MKQVTISDINKLDQQRFVELLGGIYEHSPWIAEAAWDEAGFTSIETLHAAMARCVDTASNEQKLQLLRAHPEFAGREATAGELTEQSASEQSRLSLQALPAKELAQMRALNRQFMDKFGFPGIVAVRLHSSVDEIFTELERRRTNEVEQEMTEAVAQVHHIALFRLMDMISDQ